MQVTYSQTVKSERLQNVLSAAPRRAQFVYFVILSPRLLRNVYCLLPVYVQFC